ncbi:hypothetical protein [Brevibacillus porteri]
MEQLIKALESAEIEYDQFCAAGESYLAKKAKQRMNEIMGEIIDLRLT